MGPFTLRGERERTCSEPKEEFGDPKDAETSNCNDVQADDDKVKQQHGVLKDERDVCGRLGNEVRNLSTKSAQAQSLS